MQVKASLKYLHISPRKVRLVTDLVRNMDVKEAETQLKFLNKRAAEPVFKLLNSAIANALNSFNLEKDNLFISSIQVSGGPPFKRWRPRAMGKAAPIMKRTSHIDLIIETKEETKTKKKKEKRPEVIKAKEIKKRKPIREIVGSKESDSLPVVTEKRKKPIPPSRPYSTSSKSKKKFWSRQTFGNVKKMFRRKSF